MEPKIDPKIVIDFLNEMFKLDRNLVNKLIQTRHECNDKVTDHPTIQVMCDPDGSNPKVGLLGILNGLIGCDENNCGFVYAEYDNSDNLVGFCERKGK